MLDKWPPLNEIFAKNTLQTINGPGCSSFTLPKFENSLHLKTQKPINQHLNTIGAVSKPMKIYHEKTSKSYGGSTIT